jgi:acetyl-CoA acetyltransferase family protein
MKVPGEIVILEGARTAMAEYGGVFSDISAIDLAAAASREALGRSGTEPGSIEHVIFGNVIQSSSDAAYGARHVGLKAGVPVEVPAVTVNRLCGSGFEALAQGAQRLMLGESRTVLVGGMENMTQAPHVLRGARKGFRLGGGKLEDSLFEALLDSYCGLMMAQTSDAIARKYGIARDAQDRFALSSQQRAAAAQQAGRLAEEIVAVEISTRKGPQKVDRDDSLRPDTTLEALARLKASFGADGMVTAGNASGIVDGAAAMVVTTGESARSAGRRPLGRLVSWATVGVEPALMGMGPAPAARKAMELAGIGRDDVDLWEINEAFAGQILGVVEELGIGTESLNVNGGAIALGHPLGATGARLVLSLLRELRRRGKKIGVAGACIGGGQGIAMVLEAA